MLDIKFIRENPEKAKEGCRKRGVDCEIDKILELDEKRRTLLRRIEALRAQQNKIGKGEREKGRQLKGEIQKLSPALENIEQELEHVLFQIPNIPLEDVPAGDESKNKILRRWGEPKKFDFKPKDHLELGEKLDLIDVKRAGKVSGSRFAYLKGDAVLIEFALVQFAFEAAFKEGFIPLIPPVLIKPDILKGMGYIDTDADLAERYFLEKDNLFLVGTAEQSVGPMHSGEVFEEKELPRRYVAFSTCFREEAGSYGKDTRGMFRVHQFDKVELFSFCNPEKSKGEHQFLVELEEKLWQALEIPYQVVQLAAGDMSRPAASTIDIEAWFPGQGRYREVSSASHTTDFQARRLNIRYKANLPTGGSKLEFVHMLNATGIPVGRAIIAIFENCQEQDGSIKIPKVLQRYVGKERISK